MPPRRSVALLPLLALALSLSARSQEAPDPSREVTTTEIPGVIAGGTPVRLLRAGLQGTEGAIGMWDGSMLFCEFNLNRIVRVGLDGTFTTFLEDANRAIGLGYDRNGRLIAAQSRDPRIGVLAPMRTSLAEWFEGQPLVRPNDVVIDRKGGIYFSDPIPAPQMQFREPPAGRKPLLFYIRPDGRLTKLTDMIAQPNGVQLSTDEKTFYAVDGDHITAFDVQRDGSVKNPRRFANATGDGLAVDASDRLYVATEQGIQVFDATGKHLGLIPTPVSIQSMAFAGPDRRTLYAVGRGVVLRIAMLARGISTRAK